MTASVLHGPRVGQRGQGGVETFRRSRSVGEAASRREKLETGAIREARAASARAVRMPVREQASR